MRGAPPASDWSEGEPDYGLLARVFGARATAAEAAAVARWVGDDPDRRAEIERLRLVWGMVGELPVPHRSVAAWARVAPRLQRESARLQHRWPLGVGVGVGVGKGTMLESVAIAASIVAVLGVGATIGVARYRARSNRATGREYVTVSGQRLNVTLVDGTQMTLAPASRARIPATCRGGLLAARCVDAAREVEIEGEAYFAVVRDAAHPFAVRARGAVVRDLGTAFDVRAYPEDKSARIAVTEGEVAISAPAVRGVRERSVSARAGDVATVGPSGVAVEHGADVTSLVGWRQGELAFTRTPLRDVVRELARCYGAPIELRDTALAGRPFSARFPTSSLTDVLSVIAAAVGGRYELVDGTYRLYDGRP